MDIVESPLIRIGGRNSDKKNITIFMHEGWDRPCLSIEYLCDWIDKRNDIEDAEFYLIDKDLSNPYYSWPIYFRVKKIGWH